MVYRRLFVISRAALSVIVGLLMTSGSGAARQAAPASPPSAAVSAIAPDDEIRRILVKRIDTDKQSLGIVVGILEPKGRRLVAHGRLAKDDARPLKRRYGVRDRVGDEGVHGPAAGRHGSAR
jgi:hypothetical protein